MSPNPYPSTHQPRDNTAIRLSDMDVEFHLPLKFICKKCGRKTIFDDRICGDCPEDGETNGQEQ